MTRGSSTWTRVVPVALLAWMSLAYAGDRMRVITDQAEVKLGSKVLKTLTKGAEFEAVARNGAWVGIQVEVDGQAQGGWIYEKCLEVVAPPQPEGMAIPIQTAEGPAEVKIPGLMAFIRCHSLQETFRQTQALLMAVNPMLGGMVSPEMLGAKMGWENLAGWDRERPFGVLILDPSQFEEGVVGVFPVSDFEAFSENCSAPQTMKLGTYALLGEDQAALEAMAGALQKLQALSTESLRGELDARIDLAAVLRRSREQLDEYQEMLKGLMLQAQQIQGGGGNPELTAALLEAEIRWLRELAEQIQEVSFTLRLRQDGLRWFTSLEAIAGTALAQAIENTRTPNHRLAQALPSPEALFGMSVDFGGEGWTALLLDFVKKVLAVPQLADESTRRLADRFIQLYGGFRGQFAMTANVSEQGLTFVQAFGLSEDSAATRAALKEALELFTHSELAKMSQAPGMSMEFHYQAAAREKDGVPIDTLSCPIKLEADAAENPMLQQQLTVMKMMYGDPLRVELACVDRWVLTTLGAGGEAAMDALLSRVRGDGGEMPAQLRLVEDLFEPEAQIYGALSLQQVMDFAGLVMKTMAPQVAPPTGLPPIQGPPVALYGKCRGKRLELGLYLPTQPAAAIQARVMQMMIQGAGRPGPGGGDAPEPTPETF